WAAVHGATFRFLVIIAAVFVAALAVRYSAKRPRGQAALVATLPLLPLVAVVCAVVIFLAGGNHLTTPIASFLLASLVWCLAANSCGCFLTVEHCNQSSFGELRHRNTQLGAHLLQTSQMVKSQDAVAGANLQRDAAAETEVAAPETKAVAPETKVAALADVPKPQGEQGCAASAAYEEALKQRAAIAEELADKLNGEEKRGLGWVLATGYISVWKRLHRAEEALIEVLPAQTVIAGALEDELRLIGSKIENRDDLLKKLRHAIVALDQYAVDFLELSADESKALAPATAQDGKAQRETMARPILRMVRRAINEYRDDLYGGLVMNRNRTWGATIFTGLTAFMLLAIAMVMGASRTSIVAGATFFFVGATVGLLGRLRNQMEEEGGVPDYGLS